MILIARPRILSVPDRGLQLFEGRYGNVVLEFASVRPLRENKCIFERLLLSPHSFV